MPESEVAVVGPAYFGPGCTGRHSYDSFQVAVFVERDEVRAVGDDKILARTADSAGEPALHGGLEVHGWLVEHPHPAPAVSHERTQDQRLLDAPETTPAGGRCSTSQP